MFFLLFCCFLLQVSTSTWIIFSLPEKIFPQNFFQWGSSFLSPKDVSAAWELLAIFYWQFKDGAPLCPELHVVGLRSWLLVCFSCWLWFPTLSVVFLYILLGIWLAFWIRVNWYFSSVLDNYPPLSPSEFASALSPLSLNLFSSHVWEIHSVPSSSSPIFSSAISNPLLTQPDYLLFNFS